MFLFYTFGHVSRTCSVDTLHNSSHAHCNTDAYPQGLTATVTLKNGDRYTGIFSSAQPESSPSQYTLKMVRKLPSHGKQANGVAHEQAGEGSDRSMLFEVSDVLDLSLESVRLDHKVKTQNGMLKKCTR